VAVYVCDEGEAGGREREREGQSAVRLVLVNRRRGSD